MNIYEKNWPDKLRNLLIFCIIFSLNSCSRLKFKKRNTFMGAKFTGFAIKLFERLGYDSIRAPNGEDMLPKLMSSEVRVALA